MYVYLRQGAQSGEDCVRQRGQLVARKTKKPCGEEGGNSQTYTLPPSQRLCMYVSACARMSVCQCCTSACLPQETTTSIEHTYHNGHRYANARNMHLKVLLAYTSYGKV